MNPPQVYMCSPSHNVPLELVVALMRGLTPRMRTEEENAYIGWWEEK